MYELSLFAGAGGGILGGKLLGWRCIGAVEIEGYRRGVLAQRQNDGILDPFPIWDDIKTFRSDNPECSEYFELLRSVREFTNTNKTQREGGGVSSGIYAKHSDTCGASVALAHTQKIGLQTRGLPIRTESARPNVGVSNQTFNNSSVGYQGPWTTEPDVDRMAYGVAHGPLKALELRL